MFRYFPKNYVWNLSVDLSIEMGARIGEIEEMCAPLLAASEHPDAEGTRAFRETWSRMADKLCALAGEDEARGRRLSAGEKYLRAANYYLTCERLQAHGAPDRDALYRRFLDVFAAGLHHTHANCQRVTIPYAVSYTHLFSPNISSLVSVWASTWMSPTGPCFLVSARRIGRVMVWSPPRVRGISG